MYKSIKIKLYPTKLQEKNLFKEINASRFIYNWGIEQKEKYYNDTKEHLNFKMLSKKLTELKKDLKYQWLNEVHSKTLSYSIRNLDLAYKSYFKNGLNKPKFKSKKSNKLYFYKRTDQMNIKKNKIFINKNIGYVKMRDDNRLPKGIFYNTKLFYKCSINYINNKWYMILVMNFEDKNIKLNKDLILGIDLGLKKYATLSNGIVFENFNNIEKIKILENDVKVINNKISNKLNINDNKITNNIKKLYKLRLSKFEKLKNIRIDFIHKITKEIVDLKPIKIVVEDLHIQELQRKSKHISYYISLCNFYSFKEILRYKCLERGIEFVVANKYFASSKICSNCGNKKKFMSLSDRIYRCDKCSLEIDRDLNASINLKNYQN